jgi:hypothetical protein
MAAEDRNGKVTTKEACTDCSPRENAFDELARGLAYSTLSRRRALRILSGALFGGMLTSVPGVAWAARGGNSTCAKFCRENFPPGRERGECISAGARGEGPCFDNGGGNCDLGGIGTSCQTGFLFGCQNSGNCFCMKTTEGTTFCAESSFICDPGEATVCSSSQDCPPGWACAATCCNPELETTPVCNPPCGTVVGVGAASSGNQGKSGH